MAGELCLVSKGEREKKPVLFVKAGFPGDNVQWLGGEAGGETGGAVGWGRLCVGVTVWGVGESTTGLFLGGD